MKGKIKTTEPRILTKLLALDCIHLPTPSRDAQIFVTS